MSWKPLARAFALASSLSAVAGAAQAFPVLDQLNAPGFTGLNATDSHWQQQVTAGMSGQLVGIVLYASQLGPDNPAVSVGTGAPAYGRSFTYTTAPAMLSLSGTYFDVSAANLFVTTGSIFTIDIGGGSFGCCGVGATQATVYPGGDLFLQGLTDDSTNSGVYLSFQTFVDNGLAPPPVPEPASLLLLAGGLAVLRRRKR